MDKQELTPKSEIPSWMMHATALGKKILREETEKQEEEREQLFRTPSARAPDINDYSR